jgi:hypothetical protein
MNSSNNPSFSANIITTTTNNDNKTISTSTNEVNEPNANSESSLTNSQNEFGMKTVRLTPTGATSNGTALPQIGNSTSVITINQSTNNHSTSFYVPMNTPNNTTNNNNNTELNTNSTNNINNNTSNNVSNNITSDSSSNINKIQVLAQPNLATVAPSTNGVQGCQNGVSVSSNQAQTNGAPNGLVRRLSVTARPGDIFYKVKDVTESCSTTDGVGYENLEDNGSTHSGNIDNEPEIVWEILY